MADRRNVTLCEEFGRKLQRDWDAAPVVIARPLDLERPKTWPRHTQSGEKAEQSFQNRGSVACLDEMPRRIPILKV